MKGFTAHACALDGDCRDMGAPNRVYLGTRWGVLIVGIGRDNWTQGWFPKVGYSGNRWLPIVWHPRIRKTAR
jgi:hypothetical protein